MLQRWHRFVLLSFLMVGSQGWWSGCATRPTIDWAPRVGVYTYDQAVIDMGPPDKKAILSDDSIVAEWLTRQGRYYNSAVGFGGGVYGHPYGWYGPYPSYYMAPSYVDRTPDSFVRLVFNPEGLLADWTEFRR